MPCYEPGCDRQCIWGLAQDQRGKYCKEHAPSNAVTMKSIKCQSAACTSTATYGTIYDKIRIRCVNHANDNMINLNDLLCVEKNCKSLASYGDGKNRIYCATHATNNSAPMGKKLCEEKGCKTRPSYGYVDGPATFCKKHCKDSMVDVVSNLCEDTHCNKSACFGYVGKAPSRCSVHADLDMVNLMYPTCATAGCGTRIHPEKHPGIKFCASCDVDGRRPARSREMQAANAMSKAGLYWNSWNKEIGDGRVCGGRYRPDFVFERPSFTIIIEIDEFQHSPKGYECDNRRMLDIFNAYGGLPVHFIRFNPDEFRIGQKKCTQDGMSRLLMLIRTLKTFLDHPPSPQFTITRLYYDHPSKSKSTTRVTLDRGVFDEIEWDLPNRAERKSDRRLPST